MCTVSVNISPIYIFHAYSIPNSFFTLIIIVWLCLCVWGVYPHMYIQPNESIQYYIYVHVS